jgi:hypothetical protein
MLFTQIPSKPKQKVSIRKLGTKPVQRWVPPQVDMEETTPRTTISTTVKTNQTLPCLPPQPPQFNNFPLSPPTILITFPRKAVIRYHLVIIFIQILYSHHHHHRHHKGHKVIILQQMHHILLLL